jgi:hypothetical protein
VLAKVKTGGNKSGASKLSEDLALKFVKTLTDPTAKWCFFELILARSKEERAEILSDWHNIALINRILSKFRVLPESARDIVMMMAKNEMKYIKVPDMGKGNDHEILPMRPSDNPSFENSVRTMEEVASSSKKAKTAQDHNSMTLQDLVDQHPEWLGHTLVIYTSGQEYDYVGATGSVYEDDEMKNVTGQDAEPTGVKLLVFAAN